MSGTGNQTERPLSPHLQIYKPQWTSVLSITHRATGLALALGTLLIVYWLVAAASGPEAFAAAQACIGSSLGRLALFGWSAALFYHLANGVRHLFWDAGRGFELETAYLSGLGVLAATVILTTLAWLLGYWVMGAF
ncbi:MAG: succinate dehydrogenase, cytochrome b556 subunit [Alphaproteobacteria bacterium]